MEKLDGSDFLQTEFGQIAQGGNKKQSTVMMELKLVPFSTVV